MSAIPIYSSSPISPATAKRADLTNTDAPNSTASCKPTAATATSTSSYASALPGASVPGPTQTPGPSSSYQPSPTRTVDSMSYGKPPPPQPGAAPAPFSSKTAGSGLPPPPKAGEKPLPPANYVPPAPTATPHTQPPYPPQMSIPPPNPSQGYMGQPPTSTTIYSPPIGTPPTHNLPFEQIQQQQPTPTGAGHAESGSFAQTASLEHPPGYMQNPYATDMTPQQRFTHQATERTNGSPALGYTPESGGGNVVEGMTETMWKWAKGIGENVGKAEEAVWRKIEGK